MRRLLVVLSVLLASSLAIGTATAPAKTIRKCIPNRQTGIEVDSHANVIVYCGSARATLHTGGKTTHLTNGMCLRSVGAMSVGFGKYTSLQPIAVSSAFLLVAPAYQDGSYRLGVLTIQRKGQKMTGADHVKVVVKGKRTRGTFSGRFQNGKKFTGSFTCK